MVCKKKGANREYKGNRGEGNELIDGMRALICYEQIEITISVCEKKSTLLDLDI